MNREIKFRVWIRDMNQMSYTSGLVVSNNNLSTFEEFIPLQYTGLKDCNGKEVYEGDVLSIGGIKIEVKFEPYYTNLNDSYHLGLTFFGCWGFPSEQIPEIFVFYGYKRNTGTFFFI